ncbi:hypothetical protein [Streptomyces fragilis]|uniref:hypothetical protein n=1 Tax=Streptomyces fragilis TaxID=67301 RepID=UPI0024DE25FC|nr:hypothetical protein [Streptomyces fragilis]
MCAHSDRRGSRPHRAPQWSSAGPDGPPRCSTEGTDRPVSYTHLDVYKRQVRAY